MQSLDSLEDYLRASTKESSVYRHLKVAFKYIDEDLNTELIIIHYAYTRKYYHGLSSTFEKAH